MYHISSLFFNSYGTKTLGATESWSDNLSECCLLKSRKCISMISFRHSLHKIFAANSFGDFMTKIEQDFNSWYVFVLLLWIRDKSKSCNPFLYHIPNGVSDLIHVFCSTWDINQKLGLYNPWGCHFTVLTRRQTCIVL